MRYREPLAMVYVDGQKITDKDLRQMLMSVYEPIRLLALELVHLREENTRLKELSNGSK